MRLQLTQRQINLLLMALMALGTAAEFVIFGLKDGISPRVIGYGCGAIVAGTAFVAYLRGWDRARYLVVIAAPILVGLFVYIADSVTMEVFLPPVVALILAEPIWIAAASATTIALIAMRAGGNSIYLAIDNAVLYIVIVGGLVLSRIAVDTSQRLAAANAIAHAARQEAEERAHELAERNAQLNQTLAENASQREVILELSVPILPLTERALILPLVGALDSARLEHARNRVLEAVHASTARLLIIDLTGVSVIDTHVARDILNMIRAVRLLGTSVALAGIRGEIAQTIIGLGLDLGDVTVFRDVRSVIQAGVLREEYTVAL
jgi:anti-anti-sigma regulatory factor